MAVKRSTDTGSLIDRDGSNKPVDSSGKPTMHVKVYSPFRVYFDQMALSLSGENATGPFDILPHHHNFISLLPSSELVLRTITGEQRIKISGGVMHVKADEVAVFLDV